MIIIKLILWLLSGFSLAVLFTKKWNPLHIFIAAACSMFILPNILLALAFLFHTHISTGMLFLLTLLLALSAGISLYLKRNACEN